MSRHFTGMGEKAANHLRQGGADSYGNVAERAVSDGSGLPCRACLKMIRKGQPYLIAAYRPFSTVQPYAETGPIFLHERDCGCGEMDDLPEVFDSSHYIVRGYGSNERIIYGTGGVTARDVIVKRVDELLSQPNIEFVDVRSASNNCWQARAKRR